MRRPVATYHPRLRPGTLQSATKFARYGRGSMNREGFSPFPGFSDSLTRP